MFLTCRPLCWRQLLHFSLCVMLTRMCATVALCLVLLLAVCEGFFIPISLRKQAPQTGTPFNGQQQWVSNQTPGSNGVNNIQGGYANLKDYNGYPQQQQQQQQLQQSPQQQQLQQQQQLYSQHQQNYQGTAPKYEATPFQAINQPQYAYEGAYPAPLSSYSQSVQLVPCLCPLNKEIMEQQNQQLQQQNSLPASPTSSSLAADTSSAPPAPPNQKKTS